MGTIYRDRLILVNPNTAQDQVLVSEIGDTSVPGEFYQFFPITDALQGVVSDPFTLNVTNETRETITACVGWQDNVFVFTNSNTYAIAGGEQFGESSYAVGRVSTYGAFNQNCVVVTNFTVLYMNRFGIFDLMNKPSSDSYGSFERSVAIRRLFNNEIVPSSLDRIHWLKYNESTNGFEANVCGDGIDLAFLDAEDKVGGDVGDVLLGDVRLGDGYEFLVHIITVVG